MMGLIVKEMEKKDTLFCVSVSFYQVYAVNPNPIDQIEIQGSRNFHGIRDQDLQQFWDLGSKLIAKMWDQSGKKNTSLRPWDKYP